MNKVALIILAFALLTSCVKVDVVEVELPTDDEFIVQGNVIKDQPFSGVRITRTMPVNDVYNLEEAVIKDALAFIRINNLKMISLGYSKAGWYKPTLEPYARSGDKYELFVKIGDTDIYAQTVVPDTGGIVSKYFTPDSTFQINILGEKSSVYGAIWEIHNDSYDIFPLVDFYNLIEPVSSDIPVIVYADKVPAQYKSFAYANKLFLRIYAFDIQYREFYFSGGKSVSVDNPYGSSGGRIKWNVKSTNENAIGLFIGMAINKPVIYNLH
ncbi:MAG: DUF4249 family protein [Melioribacteraceae bacterium]|nr:DUF4249 family protein [Melioribacteraceae bacterium]